MTLMSQVKHNACGYPIPTRTGMKLGYKMDRAEERA
jgi:hypothetical protein